MQDGLTVGNGIAWSADDRSMYLADTFTKTVWRYDFDLASGVLANRRPFISTTHISGFVDGATVDADGCYWAALFRGGAVAQFDPDGRLVRQIRLPVSNPTMCAFGGPDLDVLYVTSASRFLDETQLREQPLPGTSSPSRASRARPSRIPVWRKVRRMSGLPLQGVRVLECASVIAGPYCSYMLTLLGAETIKIERPSQGDWMRSQGGDAALVAAGMGSTFLSCNAGKRSVALNLKDPPGRQDRARDRGRRRRDDRELAPRHGGAAGSGLRRDQGRQAPRRLLLDLGLRAGRTIVAAAAYDHVIQAVSGIMSVTGTPETAPSRTGPPLVDYLTGLSAAVAILAALRERDRTDEAQEIDVGMLDCAVAGMGSILSAYVNGGVPAAPVGNAAASGAPSSGLFPTKTSPLTVVANTEAQFAALCGVLGQPGLLCDPRFREPAVRKQNQAALREIIASCLAERPAIEWEGKLAEAGVPDGDDALGA